MKINIKIVVFPLIIFLLISLSFTQERETLPIKLNKLSTRLYEILEGRGANGGVYIGDNGVLVIDAKMDKRSVDETIAEIGKITDKPIKYLVNTHSDGDHVWGNQYFPQETIFIAHENCRKEFLHTKRDGTKSDWIQSDLEPFIPSITFSDKMDVRLGSKKVELWYLVLVIPQGTLLFISQKKK